MPISVIRMEITEWLLVTSTEKIFECCVYRYRLQFDRESKAEIEARKKAAQEPLEYVAEVCVCMITTAIVNERQWL